MKYVLNIFLSFLSIISHANDMSAVVAKVTGTGTYDDGSIYVFFDRAISSCTTTGRLDISADHPANRNILSIAMAAFMSGKNVKIHPGSCDGNRPVFGNQGDSYLYLTDLPLT